MKLTAAAAAADELDSYSLAVVAGHCAFELSIVNRCSVPFQSVSQCSAAAASALTVTVSGSSKGNGSSRSSSSDDGFRRLEVLIDERRSSFC